MEETSGITTTAPSSHKAGFCALLTSDDFSALVHSWFKATAKIPNALEVKEESWDVKRMASFVRGGELRV